MARASHSYAGSASMVASRHIGHNANVMKFGMLAVLVVAVIAVLPGRAFAVEAGQPAPGFALPDAHGGVVALDKLRGQLVYVDFWASWCGPCRRSFPWMNEMQRKYGGRGFAIVAVNVDKKRADAEKFLAQIPATFPIVFDETGATPTAFGVTGMPSSYLIDARGNVVVVERGFLDASRAELEDRIKSMLTSR